MDIEEQSLSITKYVPPELSPILYLCSHVLCFGYHEMAHEAQRGLRRFISKNY